MLADDFRDDVGGDAREALARSAQPLLCDVADPRLDPRTHPPLVLGGR